MRSSMYSLFETDEADQHLLSLYQLDTSKLFDA